MESLLWAGAQQFSPWFGFDIFGSARNKEANSSRECHTGNHVGIRDIGLCQDWNHGNATQGSNINRHVWRKKGRANKNKCERGRKHTAV